MLSGIKETKKIKNQERIKYEKKKKKFVIFKSSLPNEKY